MLELLRTKHGPAGEEELGPLHVHLIPLHLHIRHTPTRALQLTPLHLHIRYRPLHLHIRYRPTRALQLTPYTCALHVELEGDDEDVYRDDFMGEYAWVRPGRRAFLLSRYAPLPAEAQCRVMLNCKRSLQATVGHDSLRGRDRLRHRSVSAGARACVYACGGDTRNCRAVGWGRTRQADGKE